MFVDVHSHLDMVKKEGISIKEIQKKADEKKVKIVWAGVNPKVNRKILDESDFQDKSIQVSKYEKTIINIKLKQDIYPHTILISGVSPGLTFVKLQLIHSGHPDYTATKDIPIKIE